MDEPETVWVTHPSFRSLDQDDELLIQNYFSSTRKSGGGPIETVQRVGADTSQQTLALLIKFVHSASVDRVCNRSHKLSDVFLSKPEKFTSVKQTLIVRRHQSSAAMSTAAAPDDQSPPQSWVVLDELEDNTATPSDQQSNVLTANMPASVPLIQTGLIEVFDFPEDCSSHELIDHFSEDPFRAFCKTLEDQILNKESNTYIMEFTLPEIERILSKPDQFLDDDDVDSMIKVRMYTPPVRQVKLSSPKDTSARVIKKFLKAEDVEKLEAVEHSKRDFIITFSKAEDAEKFVSRGTVSIQPTLVATVELCDDTSSLNLKSVTASMTASAFAASSVHSERSSSPMSVTNSTLTLSTNDFTPMPSDSLLGVTNSTPTKVPASSSHRASPAFSPHRASPATISGHSSNASRTRSPALRKEPVGPGAQIQYSARLHTSQIRDQFKNQAPACSTERADSPTSTLSLTPNDFTLVPPGSAPPMQVAAPSPHRDSPRTILHGHSGDASGTQSPALKSKPVAFIEQGQQSMKSSNNQVPEMLQPPADGNDIPGLHQDSPVLKYTHLEVEKLPKETPESMHEMVEMHIEDQAGTDWATTKLQQSYDTAKQVLRFDMEHEDIMKLLSTKQLLFEGDEGSALTIRPLATGNIVTVTVVTEASQRRKLDRNQLMKYFGETGPFSCKVEIIHFSLAKADLQMETFSVATLIVSIGEHSLGNSIRVRAAFATPRSISGMEEESEAADNALVIESKLSYNVLKKFMKTKHKGNVTEKLSASTYLVEFANADDARKVLELEVLEFKEDKILVKSYDPAEDVNTLTPDSNIDETATHIEIKALPDLEVKEMFQMLELHFDDVLGNDWVRTKIEHSYDNVQHVFRFDMPPAAIFKLTKEKQFLDADKPHSEIQIEVKHTGKIVVVTSVNQKGRISKNQLRDYFGPRSEFQSEITVQSLDGSMAEVELGSCSVSSRIVSQRRYKLKNDMLVDICFPGSADEMMGMKKQLSDEPGSNGHSSQKIVKPPNAALASFTSKAHTALLVDNLLDVDHQTLYFWIQCVTGSSPRSIQFAAEEEKAIVKLDTDVAVDLKKLRNLSTGANYHLHGEKLSVSEVRPTTQIRVICSSDKSPGQTIDKDNIETYFSNPKYTGIHDYEALLKVKEASPLDGLQVFIVTYKTPQDVDCVIRKKPHKQSQWKYDVAEYYPDVGVCKPNSLVVYPQFNINETEVNEASKTPALFIKGVKNSDLGTLKLLMAHQKRSGGGAIAFCDFLPSGKGGVVKLVYEDPRVAERVYYKYYEKSGLELNSRPLEMELELPWLNEKHDKCRVRISGLTDELDPEKLKFYLSALSNNVVTNMSFNKEQTRAVAEFSQPLLNFGQLLYYSHVKILSESPSLKIQQELVPYQLIATGKLTKDNIELPLENMLRAEFDKDVMVAAEKLEGFSDKWKITTEPEALEFVVGEKHRLHGCDSLTVYSEFLGLYSTCGAMTKSEDLSSIVSDPLMLHFLQRSGEIGNCKLKEFLGREGMSLANDGTITANLSSDKKSNREALKKWRKLKESMGSFIDKNFAVYRTDNLTQQVYNKLKTGLDKLFINQGVLTKVIDGEPIAIAGEKSKVEELKRKLLSAISKCETDIQEEKVTKREIMPNVPDYQLEFLQNTDFFAMIQQKHNLKAVCGDPKQHAVIFTGVPAKIEAAQKEILAMLPLLSQSKVTEQKKPIFLKILNTPLAEKSIKQQLLGAGKLQAVWTVENRTLSVYAMDRPSAEKALSNIHKVIWEAQYPQDREFDDMEKKLLGSGKWNDKRAELCKMFEPLEIVRFGDKPALSLAGLSHHKANILEEIPYFFSQNVRRRLKYDENGEKIQFLRKYKKEVFREMESKHDVKISVSNDGQCVEIEGTEDNNANCRRSLIAHLKDVICNIHTIEDPARIQHINEDFEFLEHVGLKNNCLVVRQHDGEPNVVTPSANIATAATGVSANYTVTLPSGVMCEVKRGDITLLSHDGIVNAANGDLQHVGGLARNIIVKGGSSIQHECTDFVRRRGKLMEGEVMTSAPGKLSCKRIIHAVGPRYVNGRCQEEVTLLNCIDNCFIEAEKENMKSVAIPPISTGIFGYPMEGAVRVIVEAIDNRDRNKEYLPPLITLIDNKDDSLRLFERELRSKFEKVAEKTKPKTSSMSPTTMSAQPKSADKSKFTLQDKTIKMPSGLNIEIVFGDIVDSEEDCLVNSVGKDLNLSNGKVAVALAAKAGSQLQTACTALAPINPGEVKETDGFNLACRKVLHCSSPQWQGPQTIPFLKQIVMDCLTKAASNSHVSITFPALGTGNLGYPAQATAQYMIETMMEYSEKNPKSSIADVKIIIFHLDIKTKKGFEEELARLSSSKSTKLNLQPKATLASSPPSDTPHGMTYGLSRGALKGCVNVNNTKVRVVKGDITVHKADVLVNSTDSMLSIQGQVSKALITKAGEDIRAEVKALSRNSAPDGLWVSRAGKLNANHIFHINSHFMGSKSAGSWSKIITTCLNQCDLLEMRSIAFPALGTGALGVDPKDMAKILLETVIKYVNSNPQSYLTTIDVVIFQDMMVKDFVDSMRKSTEKKEPFWKRFAISVSNLFFGQGYETEPIGGGAEGATEIFHDDICKLAIYAGSPQDLQQCKKDLEAKLDKAMKTLIWKSDKPTYPEDKEFIAKLTKGQLRKLKDDAAKLHVNLSIDQKTLNIKIVGRQAEVFQMADLISAELKNIEKGVFEKKEEELVALARQWEYQDEEAQWIKFDPSLNKNLEDTYMKNATALFRYETSDGSDVKVDMGTDPMKLIIKGTELPVRRLDLSKPQTAELNLPDTWVKPLDTYAEYVVVAGSAEYQVVEKEFMATLGAGGNSIIEVKRVQNPTLYKQYIIQRERVAKKLGKPEDQVEKTPLWHGTDVGTVSKITAGNFDRGYTGKNMAAYGNGTYFARDSRYSAQQTYSPPDGNGHKYIIQTRVITGDWDKGVNGMKAPPYKPNAPTEQFDSVVNDVANPSIFVVFHDASAYPEYIIKFV